MSALISLVSAALAYYFVIRGDYLFLPFLAVLISELILREEQ